MIKMAKKKLKQSDTEINNVINEPNVVYAGHDLTFFNSIEEQNRFELEELSKLNSEEILRNLRKFINISFGMKGYNPENLPTQHKITFKKPRKTKK